MKTLYFECRMGAAGDMICAALTELVPDKEKVAEELNSLGIPGVTYSLGSSEKCGITGTRFTVSLGGEEEDEHLHEHAHSHDEDAHHHHHHHHRGMAEIEGIITSLDLNEKVRQDALNVFRLIAEAESAVHGKKIDEIHFHEVGTMDAIADVVAACVLIDRISPDKIASSPVHVGSGKVLCAHGELPVPAPATAYILKGVPVYSDGIDGELCTPTGAAILKYFASGFGPMPAMTLNKTGYGMGKKDFERANCIRAMLGESGGGTDAVSELSFNVDDMTAEAISFASERFYECGAKEVYTVPAGMKKSRSGVVVNVICAGEDRDKMLSAIFRYTSTIGVREKVMERYVLDRENVTCETRFGAVRKKVSSGYGVKKEKYEYDDVSRIAKENGMSFDEVLRALEEKDNG